MKLLKLSSLLLVIISLFLFYLEIQNTVTSIPLDSALGLFSMLSPLWYIALTLSIISVLICIFGIKERRYFLLCLTILIIILFGISIFGEALPRTHDVYWHSSATFELIENGFLTEPINLGDYSLSQMSEFYEAFKVSYLSNNPGAFIVGAFIFILTGITITSVFSLLKIISILLLTLIGIFSYLAFSSFLKPIEAKLATLLFILSNVYLQFHHSPQGWGILIFLVALYCFFKDQKFIYIFLSIILIFIHLPSALFFILFITFYKLIKIILNESKSVFNYLSDVFIISCFYLIYLFYFIPRVFSYFSSYFIILGVIGLLFLVLLHVLVKAKVFKNTFKNINQIGFIVLAFSLFVLLIISLVWLAQDIEIGRLLRLFFLTFSGIFGLILLYLLMKEKCKEKGLYIAISFLVTSFAFFILQFLLGGSFQINDRIYLIYIFFPVIIFTISIKYLKKEYLIKFIAITLILFAMNGLTLFYLEDHSLITNEYVSGWSYMVENVDEASYILGNDEFYPLFLLYPDDYLNINRYADIDYDFVSDHLDNYDYVVISDYFQSSSQLYGYESEYLTLKNYLESTEANLIYSNPSVSVYQLS